MIEVKSYTPAMIDDLTALFGPNHVANGCWCMWFIIPVKEYHEGGSETNRAKFCELAEQCAEPVGLLAYVDGKPAGWCAVGPKARYVRAVKTPTLKGTNEAIDSTWFAPCFYVDDAFRGHGVTQAMLEAAVSLAQQSGASAIEGFPFAGNKRRASGDVQVGRESVFAACGFEVVSRPSEQRVVMRRTF